MHFITCQTHFLPFSKAILLSFHFTQTSYTLPSNISPWPPHDLSQNLLKKARGLLDNNYSSKPDLRASRTGTGALPALKTSNKNFVFHLSSNSILLCSQAHHFVPFICHHKDSPGVSIFHKTPRLLDHIDAYLQLD